ncbi:MAG TPA: HNH endonuclease signature motif containing protein [Candidatus Paceibacterota bacterium]
MSYGPKPKPIGQLFWSRVDVSWTDQCWEWGGSMKPNGYGQFTSGPRLGYSQYAHRTAYMLLVGNPGEAVLDHLCHNKKCCNPQHLEAVSQGENVRRAHTDGLVPVKTHCPSGHEYSEENTIIDGNARRCRTCRKDQRRKRALSSS